MSSSSASARSVFGWRELSTQTRVIAIAGPSGRVKLHPRRDARLQGGDTVYLVAPYRELLATLRKGQVLEPDPGSFTEAAAG